MKTTIQVRLNPTAEQATLVRAHCQESISTINVLTQALDAGVLPDDGTGASTKDCSATLPSAVKNQALRDAHSVWKRACALGRIPLLRQPICQWNNQNWRIEGSILLLPVYQDGQVQQTSIRRASLAQDGTSGLLRIKRKRGTGIAAIACTLASPAPTPEQGVMGVDLGVKMPAVIHVAGQGTRYLGNGRYQRMMRRRCYARRKRLQQAAKGRAVRTSQGKERRWMRDLNHQLSRQIVSHAQAQGVGTIRLEHLAGIRQRLVTEREALGLHDGNREFARILHLCLSHSVAEVGAALDLAAASSRYSADAVRQLLQWADEPTAETPPLDPARYPDYHLPQPRPDLAAYNRLLVGQSGAEGGEGK